MEKAKNFTDLLVWQKAHKFVLATYELSKGFPKEELFTLTSQLRRAAISIPANIAEGFKKRSGPEKLNRDIIFILMLSSTFYILHSNR